MVPKPDCLPICHYQDTDRAALVTLWHRCALVGPDIERSIDFARNRDHIAILLGKCPEALIASVMVGHDGHAGFLYFVAVDPGHRRQGWGRAVVAAAEDWLAARGIWRAMLMIRQDNEAVTGFYDRLGWGQVPHIVMQKRLLP